MLLSGGLRSATSRVSPIYLNEPSSVILCLVANCDELKLKTVRTLPRSTDKMGVSDI